MTGFSRMYTERGVGNALVLCKCRIRLIATVILFAALTGAFFDEHVALGHEVDVPEGACDCVDVALTLEYIGAAWYYPSGTLRMGTARNNRKIDVTVTNLGTRTAYDVEVVLDIVKPENSLWFVVPSVPIGRVSSMGDAPEDDTTRGSQGGGYSIHWTIPELPGQNSATFEASAKVIDYDTSKDPHVLRADVSHDSMEFFGEVTTSSYESDLRKGNNSQRIWAFVEGRRNNSYPAYGDYSVSVSVDNLNPSPGGTVNFIVEADRGTGAMIDMKVDIKLSGGLSVVKAGTISYAPTVNRSPSVAYDRDEGVFNIGSPKENHSRLAHSVTLPVMVSSDAAIGDQCLTATVTGKPPPGEGRPYSDDGSDNVAKLCLGQELPPYFSVSDVEEFVSHPCVGDSGHPCDSTNDVRVRAVYTDIDPPLILGPETPVIHVPDTSTTRKYSGDTNSVNTGNKVSWQVPVQISARPFTNEHERWTDYNASFSYEMPGKASFDKLHIFGIGLKALLSNRTRQATFLPAYNPGSTAASNGPFDLVAEFEKVGTYMVGHSTTATHDNDTPDNTDDDVPYPATGSYIFHVGPIADLSVEDGGASPFVAADRNALAIVAVLNDPDRISGATVTGLPTGRDVLHKSQGRYDSTTGEWNTGELRPRDYYRSRGESEPTLVLSASAGDTASVSIAAPDYEVCIGPKSDPVELAHTTKATCEAVTNASWNSAQVYDYKPDNNTATITAALGTAPRGEGTPTLLETLGHPDYIILLKWQPVATLNDLTVPHYEVQKWVVDDQGKGDWKTQDSEVKVTQWVDEKPLGTHARPGDVPRYRVRAVNEAGVEGPWSGPVYWAKRLVEGAGVEVDLDLNKVGAQRELTVKEGEEFEYSINLTGRPSFMVHIYASGSGLTFVPPPVPPQDLPLPNTDTENLITFHPGEEHWDTVKKVKVRIDESLEIDDETREVKIAHSLPVPGGINHSAGYGSVTVPDVTLTVEDTTRDKVGFKSLGKQTMLMLAGKTHDYIIQPTVKPTKDVTITLESSDEDVAIIDTDLTTAGYQDKIIFRPEDFRAERVTLADGTKVYASPVSQNGPGRVRVTGVGAGQATISIDEVSGDLFFGGAPTEGAIQAVEVGKTEDSLTAPVFSEALANQSATAEAAFSYTAPAATDPDNDDITYTASLAGGEALPAWLSFAPSSRTFSGTPRRCDAPATLQLAVTATDDGAIPQSASTGFTLSVAKAEGDTENTDAVADYNRPPVFMDYDSTNKNYDSTTRSLTENSAAGTKVGAPVLACDPDGDRLKYIALDGEDGKAFALDEKTGQLTTVAKTSAGVSVSYDYEVKPSYSFWVIVEEQGTVEGYHSAIKVTVNLSDVAGDSGSDVTGDSDTGEQNTEPANRAPSFDSGIVTALSVDENSAAGTKVGLAFTATDPDTDDKLAYSLTGTDAALFDIGSSNGQITTKTGVTYNYEAKASYSLAVDVSDGKLSNSTPVTVSLNDVAEAPTVADSSQFKNHAAKVGQAFSLTLPAADANSGDGGPYGYLLWHRGAGKNFSDQAINGLRFDAATRTLSGTPTAAGVWKLSYVIHDKDSDRSVEDRFRARTNLQVTVSP